MPTCNQPARRADDHDDLAPELSTTMCPRYDEVMTALPRSSRLLATIRDRWGDDNPPTAPARRCQR